MSTITPEEQAINNALDGMSEVEKAVYQALNAKTAEVRSKIVDLMVAEKVEIGVGVSACFDICMSMVNSEFTPPGARAAFSGILMDAAHELSARVSEEQADGIMTAGQESERPKIITEV